MTWLYLAATLLAGVGLVLTLLEGRRGASGFLVSLAAFTVALVISTGGLWWISEHAGSDAAGVEGPRVSGETTGPDSEPAEDREGSGEDLPHPWNDWWPAELGLVEVVSLFLSTLSLLVGVLGVALQVGSSRSGGR